MSKVALKLENVHKIYRVTKEISVHALRGVNLEVKEEEIIVLMGPSGSGKSTLLQIVGTLDKPTKGRVIIGGIDVTDWNEKRLAYVRREKIGFVFQFFNLLTNLTAEENVMFPLLLSGKYNDEEARKKARLILSIVGLPEDRWRNIPRKLSGGQQQMVAIARAVANNPTYILADEPTGNLDVDSSTRFLEVVSWLNYIAGQTMIIVTHNPEVSRIAHRVLYIRDGILYQKAPKRFINVKAVRRTGEEKRRKELYKRLLDVEISSLRRRYTIGLIDTEEFQERKEEIENQMEKVMEK
ncbi:ABC transporter ATP-binding protein [Candidatus Bathyarchaeota archaeon ex4484_205]|nr:MAG: ABC transporter ATP-binding protein [Candidatus Bathyarchaeota archaeon ex4484_205]